MIIQRSLQHSTLNLCGFCFFSEILVGLVWLRSTPHPVTVTTRIITFLVGNPYKPSFATVTGWGVDPRYGDVVVVFGSGLMACLYPSIVLVTGPTKGPTFCRA